MKVVQVGEPCQTCRRRYLRAARHRGRASMVRVAVATQDSESNVAADCQRVFGEGCERRGAFSAPDTLRRLTWLEQRRPKSRRKKRPDGQTNVGANEAAAAMAPALLLALALALPASADLGAAVRRAAPRPPLGGGGSSTQKWCISGPRQLSPELHHF